MLFADEIPGRADVDPVPGGRRDALVPRFVEAAIALDDAEIRVAEALPDEFERPVGRAAIHDDDFVRQVGPFFQGF